MSVSENTTTLSTVIPELGMTFAEAGQQIAELIERDNAASPEDLSLTSQWTDLREAVLESEPRTVADAVVVFDMLLQKEMDTGFLPEAFEQALVNLQALLRRLLGPEQCLPQAQDGPETAFAAAVAAFEAAGESALTLPTDPSEAMVMAAVEATGCSHGQVLKGFAAMVEAWRREVA